MSRAIRFPFSVAAFLGAMGLADTIFNPAYVAHDFATAAGALIATGIIAATEAGLRLLHWLWRAA